MLEFFKNKIATVLIVIATVILAGVAVFSATRLYQMRSEPATPVSPKPIPAAEEEPLPPQPCQKLTFEITAEIAAAPVATVTPIPTITASPTPTEVPVITPTPSPTPTITTPTAYPTPIVQVTPIPTTQPELPEAGVSLPTLIIASAGTLLLILSLVFAL